LLLALLVLLAGPACRFVLSAEDSEVDAATDAATDAADCVPPAAGTGPFAKPEPIGGAFAPLNDPLIEDDDPSLTADLLEMYFDSNRHLPGGRGALWVSKRNSVCDDWGEPTQLEDLYILHPNISDPAISPDGLTLWFASTADPLGPPDQDVYVSTRASRDTDAWTAPMQIPSLDSNRPLNSPGGIGGDGLIFVMSSNRQLSNLPLTNNIFFATRTDPTMHDGWTSPEYASELSTDCNDDAPGLSEDGRTLVWSSQASAEDCVANDHDLFIAERASVDDPFVLDPERQDLFSEINVVGEFESDPWLSADGNYLVLTKEETGNPRRLYHTTRTQE
ncbi:MAG: hypothetical protein AAGC55_10135, partial [Myxococcota bacterium]